MGFISGNDSRYRATLLALLTIGIVTGQASGELKKPPKPIRTSRVVEESKEYCSSEVFEVTCEEHEVILMTKALYGRMNPGRCISGEYGHAVGCHADVLAFMDTQCSGRRRCKVVVGTMEQVAQPCQKDFKSYLDAAYKCVRIAPLQAQMCNTVDRMQLPPTGGYLARNTVLESGQYLTSCLWKIDVPLGQYVSLTLYSFQTLQTEKRHMQHMDRHRDHREKCSLQLMLQDGDNPVEESLCDRGQRQVEVYRSETNSLELSFYTTGTEEHIPHFILGYEAVGCPDIEPPTNAWSRRDGDNLMIRCNETGETWYLTCRDKDWIGDIGNCTNNKYRETSAAGRIVHRSNFLQEGIVFAVFVGLILGLVMGTGMLAAAFCCRKRMRRNGGLNSETNTESVSDTLRSSFPGLLRQEKPIGGNVCEYTHVWEVRPTPLSPSIYSKKEDTNVFTDISSFSPLPENQKTARIYESRLSALRDSRIICQQGEKPTPLYFELDPNSSCNHCT